MGEEQKKNEGSDDIITNIMISYQGFPSGCRYNKINHQKSQIELV